MTEKYYIIKASDFATLGMISEEMMLENQDNPYTPRINVVLQRTDVCNGQWYDPELYKEIEISDLFDFE